MKFIDYAETWYRTWCPYCGKDNWHCNGNESDLSGIDVEAVKCRNCHKIYRLGPHDEVLDEISGGGLSIENGCKMIEQSQEAEDG